MYVEEPTPKQVLMDLFRIYSDPKSRKHIHMKNMFVEYRLDLIRYGSISRKQFASIEQYLIYEFRKLPDRWTTEEIRSWFEPVVRDGKEKKPIIQKPKSEKTPTNTLETFF